MICSTLIENEDELNNCIFGLRIKRAEYPHNYWKDSPGDQTNLARIMVGCFGPGPTLRNKLKLVRYKDLYKAYCDFAQEIGIRSTIRLKDDFYRAIKYRIRCNEHCYFHLTNEFYNYETEWFIALGNGISPDSTDEQLDKISKEIEDREYDMACRLNEFLRKRTEEQIRNSPNLSKLFGYKKEEEK